MKRTKILSLAAAAIALTFAACTKEATTSGEVITPDMATSYAKIKISMAGGSMTRAWGDDANMTAGTADEAKVSSVHLVLYDASGYAVGTGEIVSDDISGVDANPTLQDKNNVSDKYEGVIFKLSLTPGAEKPTGVVAYVNTDKAPTVDLATANETIEVDKLHKNKKEFVMTSAGYYKGSDWTIAAPLDPDFIYTTQSGAATGTLATTIYVERLAAKVAVDDSVVKDEESLRTVDDEVYYITNVAGDEVSLVFDAKNWGTTGTAKSEYLLKQKFNNSEPTWMNKEANNRSFWAEGVNYNKAYEEYMPAGGTRLLNYISYNAAKNAFGTDNANYEYIAEHTYDFAARALEANFSPKVTATSIIVLGEYAVKKDGTAVDYEGGFFVVRKGMSEEGQSRIVIYSEKELMVELANRNYVYADDQGTPFTTEDVADNFKLVVPADTKWTIAALDDATIYVENPDSTGDDDKYIEKADADLSNSIPASHYVNGLAYFYQPIEHYSAGTGQDGYEGLYGIVRNHAYVLTINSITSLGAPIDDKHAPKDDDDPDNPGPDPGDEPIEPNPDDLKDAYINATLNVLSWHVVSQGVDL